MKKPLNFLSLEKLMHLRKDPLKSRKTKRVFEINWKIRELFSDAALASFCDEIDRKYLEIEKNEK